jgi:hypothetical protein
MRGFVWQHNDPTVIAFRLGRQSPGTGKMS